jgi:hypothetical protein
VGGAGPRRLPLELDLGFWCPGRCLAHGGLVGGVVAPVARRLGVKGESWKEGGSSLPPPGMEQDEDGDGAVGGRGFCACSEGWRRPAVPGT